MDVFMGRMDIAVEHGADVAIFVHNLVYWVEKNAANGRHFHDGRYWTYNSIKALGVMYPLWSASQIRTITKKSGRGRSDHHGELQRQAHGSHHVVLTQRRGAEAVWAWKIRFSHLRKIANGFARISKCICEK